MLIFAFFATVALAESPYDKVAGVSTPTNVTLNAIAGAYYTGDGLGYNLYLELNTNGHFNCTWNGCLGVYGTSTGTWTVAATRITLKPTDETGMLKDNPMRVLDVLAHSNQYILVKSDYKEFFLKVGLDRFTCFQLWNEKKE